MRIFSEANNRSGIYSSRHTLQIEIEFVASVINTATCVGFDLMTQDGIVLLRSYQTDVSVNDVPEVKIGKNYWCCTIPAGLLNGGIYYLCPRIGIHNVYWIVHEDPVIQFEIVLDHGISPLWNSLNGKTRKGLIAPILKWQSYPISNKCEKVLG